MENEQSKETLLVLFEDKLDNLIEAVRDIKESINHTSEQVQIMKIELVTLQNKTDQQQKEIDKLDERNSRNRGWIMTIGATVLGGFILAILKAVFGV